MSYFMVHLTMAQKILQHYQNTADRGAFYLGSIAPDAVMFRPGGKRSDKSATHFCIGNEGWGYYTNYDEWMENLILNINKYNGQINDDFLFGYFSHIITDMESARCFWNPTRMTNDKSYIDTYIKDCSEVDAELLNKIPNIDEIWSLLGSSNDSCLPDLFTCADVSCMIDNMKNEMYFNRFPDPEYRTSMFTVKDASEFMDNTITKIVNTAYRY